MRADGASLRAIARDLGITVGTVRRWLDISPAEDRRSCWRCGGGTCPEPASYGYLFGQYLGDGHLVTSMRVPCLRIACADAYPVIAAEVDDALRTQSGNTAGIAQRTGCSVHYTYWKHWPCVFPQHGPGKKHERRIVLEDWQREIVAADPWPLIRGLIHSDGCRALNRVVRRGTVYTYPRYFFANESRDILAIMGEALETAGVPWRFNRVNSISIAQRDGVAALDRHIGPKT